MASKRDIKRNLNNMVFDIVDECFVAQLLDESKEAASDAIIEEAADFQFEMLEKINAAKTKADFRPIRADFENAAIAFVEKLNAL